MSLADPDLPYLTLTRLLQATGELDDMEKVMCYSLFEGLVLEERPRLATEESLYRIIGQVVSTPEPEFDGSIPDGGKKRRPFLHLYRTMTSDNAGTVWCERPRQPDEFPSDFPVIKHTPELLDAIEYILQNFVHWEGASRPQLL